MIYKNLGVHKTLILLISSLFLLSITSQALVRRTDRHAWPWESCGAIVTAPRHSSARPWESARLGGGAVTIDDTVGSPSSFPRLCTWIARGRHEDAAASRWPCTSIDAADWSLRSRLTKGKSWKGGK